MRALLGWLGVAGLTIYLVLLGGTWAAIYSPPMQAVSLVLVAVVIAAWALVAWRDESWRPRSALAPGLLAAAAALALSTVLSRDLRMSLETLGYAAVLGSLYLLLVRLMARPELRVRLVRLARVLFWALAIGYLVVVLVQWLLWWSTLGGLSVPPLRPALRLGNPASATAIVVLLAPMVLVLGGLASRRSRLGLIAVGLTVGAVVLIAGSRSAWGALALTIVILGGAALISSRRRLGPLERRRLAGLGIGAGVLLVAGAAAFGPAIASRLGAGGADLRADFARVSLRLFAETPLVGTGPGTWAAERMAATAPGEADLYVSHAHDLVMQTIAELGVLGVVAGLILFLGVLRLVLGGARHPDATRRRWAWVAAGSILFVLLHQVFDFLLDTPAVLFAAAIPIAVLDASAADAPAGTTATAAPTRRLDRGLAPAMFAVSVVALTGLLWSAVPANLHARAVDLANAGRWAEAGELARTAVAMDPGIVPYRFTAALAAARAGDHAAAAGFFRSVAESDDLPEAWLDLAAEELLLGRETDAREHLGRALRIAGARPGLVLAAAELSRVLGDRDAATRGFTVALRLLPTLAGDPWWTADPDRAEAFRAALDADPRWELELFAGRLERARAIAAAQGDPAPLALLTAAWTGDAAARADLFAWCRREPLAAPLPWCGWVASRAGDLAAYLEFERLSAIAGRDGAASVAFVAVASPDTIVGYPAGGLAVTWGTAAYRRPTPVDLLVPSLARLVLSPGSGLVAAMDATATR